MKHNVETEIETAKQLAKAEKYDQALELIKRLADRGSDDPKIWDAQAYIYERSGQLGNAIHSLSRSISLHDKEPHPFYIRGSVYFKMGNYAGAVRDFAKVVELSDRYHSDYYREGAQFFLADAFLRMGEFSKAEAECSDLPDDAQIYTDQLRTKRDMLKEIRKRQRPI